MFVLAYWYQLQLYIFQKLLTLNVQVHGLRFGSQWSVLSDRNSKLIGLSSFTCGWVGWIIVHNKSDRFAFFSNLRCNSVIHSKKNTINPVVFLALFHWIGQHWCHYRPTWSSYFKKIRKEVCSECSVLQRTITADKAIKLGDSKIFLDLTLMERWCELSFPLYSMESLYLSEDSTSHQSLPSAPLEAARFTEMHEGICRHSKVQSKTSCTVNVPALCTFR